MRAQQRGDIPRSRTLHHLSTCQASLRLTSIISYTCSNNTFYHYSSSMCSSSSLIISCSYSMCKRANRNGSLRWRFSSFSSIYSYYTTSHRRHVHLLAHLQLLHRTSNRRHIPPLAHLQLLHSHLTDGIHPLAACNFTSAGRRVNSQIYAFCANLPEPAVSFVSERTLNGNVVFIYVHWGLVIRVRTCIGIGGSVRTRVP